jgi:2-hydroxychromene-2-carboxylate isomerase
MQLEFFYDFSCPYAYLASTQIERVAASAHADLIYKPFLLGGVFRALGAPDMTSLAPARARLNGLDMLRWAEHWQVPFSMPPGHPNRTVLALRAALASEDLPRASHALFSAYWAEGKDLSDPAVVARALDAIGMNGAALVERANDEAIKHELKTRTDEAISRGVFGAPTCFAGGQRFWGQDRLDFVARALGDTTPAPVISTRGDARVASFEFWYDFSSPFAYLAATQIDALAARAGARVVWRPFLLGALFRAIGTADVPLFTFSESKQSFIREDMQRWAELYGVPFRFPSRFPMRSVSALRLVLLADDASRDRLSGSLFRAYWADDRDIADPDELRALCAESGVDPALVERVGSDEAKLALRQATDDAVQRGLCGAPSFVVGDTLFWGQDRLQFVEKALAGWRPSAG